MTDNPNDEATERNPKQANLKSGLGEQDPQRYQDPIYPPHWGFH